MTASITKITAGSGYEYLTRQVARHDATGEARPSLSSYYTEKGESPGRWVGTGLTGLGGLTAGDRVTESQMWNLFGVGYHPLAEQLQDEMAARPDATPTLVAKAGRLGTPFKVYAEDTNPFRIEVARRFHAYNTSRDLPRDNPIPANVRAQIRTQVATELFIDQYGRPPQSARELAGHVARLSRQQTTAVAGFDVTFSPVKSVSTLWAIADRPLAAQIEQAHHRAVADALRTIESTALYTRLGAGGVRQVDVRGLVGAAFTHRDSRAGDPDLHTHVAIANKVQEAESGHWFSIDGRVLLKATVMISETYNTALERHLTETLGVRFAERPTTGDRRPIREIVGIDPRLNERWSTRREHIETRRAELARAFQATHGRPPTPTEAIALAQQATLETRDAKHAPRSEAEQRTTWHAEATQVLGSSHAITQMVARAVGRPDAVAFAPDQAWVDAAARRVVGVIQGHRSTWQSWHLQAEALRQVRTANVGGSLIDTTVEQVVQTAIAAHCVSLARPLAAPDGSVVEPDEPAVLRRADGSSQYTVAGAELFTSSPVLAAEEFIVRAAGEHDGWQVTPEHVAVALAESAANGVTLNPGQAALVTGMATSGARVQAAIAPAGSGKTTAMRALTQAWTDAGGTVIGLAPSAAAAAQLRDATNTPTDTLAKLCWHLTHHTQPADLPQIDARTLVVIDEAGMADTLSLHQVIAHVHAAGGSVRLIGDDQQLAAIGAGGILRDIAARHGVLRLDELVRFHHPAEGAASLALRQGRPEALGFYLDHHRIHVGDLTTMTDDAFTAWSTDRDAGLDTLMLAPTRELVAELNLRARTQRLTNTSPPAQQVVLADGLPASDGDTIITRLNNRRLRTSRTDWVKNGDRWTILNTRPDGSLHVQHSRTHRRITLPATYVNEHVHLGYASTIHTAQGISVDTTHGVLTGTETRQLLYTMLTRGRHANHAYLAVVSDGNEHTILAPETLRPLTPTDMLEQILGRDDTPLSATTHARHAADPATQLAAAAARYTDAIGVAAHQTADPDLIRHLTRRLEQAVPGISASDAWPALTNQLLLIAADNQDPFTTAGQALTTTLGDARDPAAVLLARLDTHTRNRGPLPWLPGIPTNLQTDPTWGPYLAARRELITSLADHITHHTLASQTPPAWAAAASWTPPFSLVADVEVYRAAHGVEPADLRPTGDPPHTHTVRTYQARLHQRLREDHSPALAEWGPLLISLNPTITTDPYLAQLARQLGHLSSQHINVRQLLTTCAEQPLPDDHPAAALWWRIAGHLDHTQRTRPHTIDQWLPTLIHHLGDHAATHQASRWWLTLVDAIDRGLQRGWSLDTLIPHPTHDTHTLLDTITRLADLHHTPDTPEEDPNPAPADLWDGYAPGNPIHIATPDESIPALEDTEDGESLPDTYVPEWDNDDLTIEATIRIGLRLEPDPTDTLRLLEQADLWHTSPPQERLELVNELAARFYQDRYTHSWARDYLTHRFGTDVHNHPDIRPGLAPTGWTTLITHLRRQGITDEELLASGVASTTRDGRLIDRFRDRVILPILNTNQQVLGFVGRRNPTSTDERAPKYLNTPDTPLFHKGNQLYGAIHNLTNQPHAIPVLVEGPFDAHSITLASTGRYIGLAPLGTSLTTLQAAQLADLGRTPIIATDNDLAGRLAAERDFWLLTPHGLDPTYAQLPNGTDPADLVAAGLSSTLNQALHLAEPLAELLITERLRNLPPADAALEALSVLAALPPTRWELGLRHLAEQASIPPSCIRGALKDHVRAWNSDRRRAAHNQISRIREVHQRLDPLVDHRTATRQHGRSHEQRSQPSERPMRLTRPAS